MITIYSFIGGFFLFLIISMATPHIDTRNYNYNFGQIFFWLLFLIFIKNSCTKMESYHYYKLIVVNCIINDQEFFVLYIWSSLIWLSFKREIVFVFVFFGSCRFLYIHDNWQIIMMVVFFSFCDFDDTDFHFSFFLVVIIIEKFFSTFFYCFCCNVVVWFDGQNVLVDHFILSFYNDYYRLNYSICCCSIDNCLRIRLDGQHNIMMMMIIIVDDDCKRLSFLKSCIELICFILLVVVVVVFFCFDYYAICKCNVFDVIVYFFSFFSN